MTRGFSNSIQKPPHSITRVSRACQRCRRQKLKCDEARPCTMCVRSGAFCLSRDLASGRRSTGKRTTRRKSVTPPPPASQEPQTHTRLYQRQRFGASSSAVGFAVNIFGEYAASNSEDISSIPGHASPKGHPKSDWAFEKLSMPPVAVMNCLLEAYFQHVHWFIFLFHEEEFMCSVSPLLHQSAWQSKDRGRVVIALMMAAVGLQCMMHDSEWEGHVLLASSSLQATSLRDDLIAEVRMHLLKLMDECNIESVQVPLLLGTYYVYYGSPILAWNMLGFSVRAAYALALHCESAAPLSNQTQSQIRLRTWNHVIIADIFTAMIYGRPALLDTAFSGFQEIIELDDTRLPPIVSDTIRDPNVTGVTFHILKYRLYEIVRTSLNLFRLMNLQNPVAPEVFCRLVEAVLQIRASLESWRTNLPTIFQRNTGFDDAIMLSMTENGQLRPGTVEFRAYKTLILQTQSLRMSYDSAVIFINRPLLEYKVSPEDRETVAEHTPVVRASLDSCFNAALNISRVSAEYHQNEFSFSFVLTNYFSAGVILCLIPTIRPFSTAASEAKAGLLRIIRTSHKLHNQSQIAQHAEQLLTRLLKRSHELELNNGLDDANTSELADTEHRESATHATPSYSPQPQSHTRDSQQPHGFFIQRENLTEVTLNPSLSQFTTVATSSNTEESGRAVFSSSLRNGDNYEAVPHIAENDRYYMMDHHVDEALGFFGQMLFNLVPNDPYSAWSWGNGPH